MGIAKFKAAGGCNRSSRAMMHLQMPKSVEADLT
jgi:hypothetical protein